MTDQRTAVDAFRVVRVKHIPRALEHGVLYISEEYEATQHLCACGCGVEVHLPLASAHGWVLTWDDGLPTLAPSIGSYQIPCRSHYFIRRGRVVWA